MTARYSYSLPYFHPSESLITSQDFVKALFADLKIDKNHRLAAINSINFSRILAQITYYFSYFALIHSLSFVSDATIRYVVLTGNFGVSPVIVPPFKIRVPTRRYRYISLTLLFRTSSPANSLSGCLPSAKLVITTNTNDILHRFWQSGKYEKKYVHGADAAGGLPEDGAQAHEDGVKETLSPAMDILVSSNFERLLWYLAYSVYNTPSTLTPERRATVGAHVRSWLSAL